MSLLATLFTLVSVVQCFSITTPSGWSNSRNATIAWTSDSSDPPIFSVELANSALLNNHPFAVATTLNKNDGSYTFNLPSVPAGDGYTLQFVNVSDINNVYATSGSFSITNNTTTSSGSVSTASATANTTSGTATSTASTSAVSSTQAQAGSAVKVGPTSALAVTLAVLGLTTLGF